MMCHVTVDTYFLHGAYFGMRTRETDGCKQRDGARSCRLFIYNEKGERAAINNNV